jgi:undecaprenyl-diphosphatase
MTLFQAVVLGAAQGLTEFLPISSSAHLFIIPRLFGWGEPAVAFDIVLHLATLLAIVIALRSDIGHLCRESLRGGKPERRVLWMLGLATIPALIVGYFLKAHLDAVRSFLVVSITLIVWGIVLWIAEIANAHMARQTRVLDQMSFFQGISIGCAQVLSFIPGTSRSGVTISAGLFLGLDRSTAARYSFLLGIPATAAAGGAALLDVAHTGIDVGFFPMLVSFLVALTSGIFAIRFLLAIVKRGGFVWFAVYRIVLGLFLLLLL